MQYKINSGQYDVTIEEAHLDVQIGEIAQMDVNQAVSYIKSGEQEIYNYVETESKPTINSYARQKADQIIEQQIQPLVSDVTIAAAHALSDSQAAAQSALEAADYAYHARFGMYERTFQTTDWQQQNGKYVITYNDARIIAAVYRNRQLMTNVDIVMADNGVSMVSETAFDGSCLLVNHVEKTGEEIDELLRRKQNVLTQTQLEAVNSGANTTNISQIATNTGDIADIDAMIPTQASTSNKLADKNFVNSSIATNTSYFIGTFNSLAELEAYSGTVTNNDYAFVIGTDSEGNTVYDRYKYTTATTPASWVFEYELNNSSFTAAQWSAINSGITDTQVAQIATNTTNISSKQDRLIAGSNIQINGSTISATDTVYTAGSGISISNGVISNTRTSVEWGNIVGNISEQADLQNALHDKQDKLTSANAGTDIEIVLETESKTVSGNGSVTITEDISSLDAVTLIGGCEQNGTPTPSQPIDIVCNNGVVKIFSGNKFTNEGATSGYIISSGTGEITENQSYSITAIIKLLKGQYTGSFTSSSSSLGNRYFRCWSYQADGTTPIAEIFNEREIAGAKTFTFTVASDCFVRMSYSTFRFLNIITQPTNPVIYTDGTVETVADSLGNTATAEMLLAVGNYKDTQEVISGSVTRNVGIKVLDGTESWIQLHNDSTDSFTTQISDMKVGIDQDGFCTHFTKGKPPIPSGAAYVQFGAGSNYVYFRWLFGESPYQTEASFKQWLADQYNAGTPVIIVYPLAIPTTETVTVQTLDMRIGNNTYAITQASIQNLPLSVTYTSVGDQIISFVNDSGYITSSSLSGYQTTSNLVTSLSISSTDSQYPSAKCVYDLVGDVETLINAL